MNIDINRHSQTPVYLQIKGAIKNLILSGELVSGQKLPSERALAAELKVNRNTVTKAYDYLVAEGYILVSRQKPKGYIVGMPEKARPFGKRFFPLINNIRYNFNDKEKLFLDIFGESGVNDAISFGGIVMDRSINPAKGMDDILGGIFRAEGFNGNGEFRGNLMERTKENICRILAKENIYVNTKNIQIVSETNQALNYIATLYLKEGDSIIVEEPIVPDNSSIFRNKGINMVTVPMESDGMDISRLERLIRKHRPKFIYTMPNWHNPTGRTMSLEKRVRLLEIANSYDIPIIEEDSQRDFRYTDRRLPSLYSMDKYQSVVYTDCFSLTFPYGVKTAYIVGPYDLVEMMEKLIITDETIVSNLGQYILDEYIERGYLTEHIEKIKKHYRAKLDLLCSELDKIRDKGIFYEKPEGGLLMWCTLDRDINEKELYYAAKRKGVLIMPGFMFYPFGYQGYGHVRLCFSNVSDEDIVKGIKLLGEAIDQCKKGSD